MENQNRILAINDISCVGKCSLTISLPVISAMGIETNVLSTAILSTHTGGFKDFTFRDLTVDLLPIVEHWQNLDLQFSGIYSGYLGSLEQVEIISEIFDKLRTKETLIFVDPIMGDNGLLYSKFSTDFPLQMRKLCEKADIITPNMTEASYLLEIPYINAIHDKSQIETILKRLGEIGPKIVCLTGVQFSESEIGAAIYNRETAEIFYVMNKKIVGSYHGTGDLFASILFAAIILKLPLERAEQLAVNYTMRSIALTEVAGTDKRFGVRFEPLLWELGEEVQL